MDEGTLLSAVANAIEVIVCAKGEGPGGWVRGGVLLAGKAAFGDEDELTFEGLQWGAIVRGEDRQSLTWVQTGIGNTFSTLPRVVDVDGHLLKAFHIGVDLCAGLTLGAKA